MKAKQFVLRSLLLLVVSQGIVSCVYKSGSWENGPRVVQSRQLKGFDKIEVYGSPSVYFFQADVFSVNVKGPEDKVDKIITTVEDGTLIIRNKGKIGMFNVSFGDMGGISVHVGSPDLTSVSLNGSGDFVCTGNLDTDHMRISLRGSGDMTFDKIICDDCVTELVGSGDIMLKRLDALSSEISLIGSGDVEVSQWNVRDTDISLRGSGDITVHFREGCKTVDCQLNGSGDIYLEGEVEQMNKHKIGSGDIDTDELVIGK
ncbi:MAG: DUF2807 domain-containing protein [Prevotella sp.]|nr:DUF2807 domain-containing protein [Prevotella sp.]